jgi:hypothetical protein
MRIKQAQSSSKKKMPKILNAERPTSTIHRLVA